MYILAPNQTAETYPYSIGMLRRDNPDTSFPRNPPAELLAEWGVYPVQATEPPAHDPITESATEGTPELVEGQWRQTWVITEATPEEIAERKEQRRQDARNQRTAAYTQEADPLFFKAQRGEAELSEWRAKVQEIRDRFPYPEE